MRTGVGTFVYSATFLQSLVDFPDGGDQVLGAVELEEDCISHVAIVLDLHRRAKGVFASEVAIPVIDLELKAVFDVVRCSVCELIKGNQTCRIDERAEIDRFQNPLTRRQLNTVRSDAPIDVAIQFTDDVQRVILRSTQDAGQIRTIGLDHEERITVGRSLCGIQLTTAQTCPCAPHFRVGVVDDLPRD